MKVAHVLTDPTGGGGACAASLARAGHLRGDVVCFVSPAPVGDELETLPLSRLPSRSVRRALHGSDVVHLHGIRAGLLPVRLGGRLVLTTHGLHALRGTDGIRRPLARAATRAALARTDLIICPSADERDDVLRLGRRFSRKLGVVPNGVEPADVPTAEERRAARLSLGIGEAEPVLLFVGGLRRQKDPLLAIEAVRRARLRLPELRLLVAGDGPLRRDVEAAAGENVALLGWRDDVTLLLAACDALLTTSRWEGQSLGVLEALWRARPVIACDAPGCAEVAREGGVVVRSRDPQQLADAIAAAFETPAMLAELGLRGRAHAARDFDEHTMIEATLALYDTLVGARGAGVPDRLQPADRRTGREVAQP